MQGETTHSHGPEGEHEHAGWAFTTWLDPALAIQQAQAVAAAVTRLLPDQAAGINDRLAALESDLQALDRRLAAAAELIGDTPLFFSHPVYQYLIRRYGLNGSRDPLGARRGSGRRRLGPPRAAAAYTSAKWMLWEGEPLEDTVAGLEDLGVGSLLFDPCGTSPKPETL